MSFASLRKHALASAALCLITLAAYSNSFHDGFALDNAFLLTEARIQAATPENFHLIWDHTYWWPMAESIAYRPFTTLTYLFNYAILGNGDLPAGYHWVNLTIHVCNVLLAYAIALRIFGGFRPAFYTAALWAVHPVLTESVTNIVGRADLLAGTCVLTGFLLYAHSTEAAGWRRWLFLIGLLVVATLGVFSKENAVTLLGIVVLYAAISWKGRKTLKDLLFAAPFILIPFAFALYRRTEVFAASRPRHIPFVDNPLTAAGFWTAHLTAVKVLARYLGLVIWPAVLSCDYSYPQIPLVSGSASDWIACAIVASALLAAALMYRLNRPAFFFALFALITLLPSSNLIVIIGSIMAERFLYLPALGILACMVLALDWAARRVRLGVFIPIFFLLIASAFSARTWARNRDWESDLTLAEAAVQACPRSFKTYSLLADALFDSDPIYTNIDRVIAAAERGLKLLAPLPDSLSSWTSYSNAAWYHMKKAEILAQTRWDGTVAPASESRREWLRAQELLLRSIAVVQLDPGSAVPHGAFASQITLSGEYRKLSSVQTRLGDAAKSYRSAVKACAADPLSPASYDALALSLRGLGRDREAARALMEGRVFGKDADIDAAIRTLRLSHEEYFDHDAHCAALEDAVSVAASIGRKVDARAAMAACLSVRP